jgi:riboflavin synthase
MNGRLDGHIVQGHVDQTALCKNMEDKNGSRIYTFEYEPMEHAVTVEKGSVCVNGVSLTVVDSERGCFTVAIIPYTLMTTSFQFMKEGDEVNLEFDIIGKYVAKLLANTIKG